MVSYYECIRRKKDRWQETEKWGSRTRACRGDGKKWKTGETDAWWFRWKEGKADYARRYFPKRWWSINASSSFAAFKIRPSESLSSEHREFETVMTKEQNLFVGLRLSFHWEALEAIVFSVGKENNERHSYENLRLATWRPHSVRFETSFKRISRENLALMIVSIRSWLQRVLRFHFFLNVCPRKHFS